MGIKMSKAYCEMLKREISINEATDEMRKGKSIQCKTEYCRANLTWAKSHKRAGNIDTKYFRLLNKKESDHDMNCPYNTIGRIRTIVSSSDNKIIESLKNGKYVFRLNLLHEAMVETEKGGPGANPLVGEKRGPSLPEKEFEIKGKMASYMSTMKKIMVLRTEIENAQELREYIKLDFDGYKVSWDDFYFERDNYERAYGLISKHGIPRGKSIYLGRPIVLHGEIRSCGLDKTGSFYLIKLKATSKDNNVTIVSLFVSHKEIGQSIETCFKKGNHPEISAYVLPWVTTKENSEKKVIFNNIDGKIYREDQLIMISD